MGATLVELGGGLCRHWINSGRWFAINVNEFDIILALCMGLGLAAASGFVFFYRLSYFL